MQKYLRVIHKRTAKCWYESCGVAGESTEDGEERGGGVRGWDTKYEDDVLPSMSSTRFSYGTFCSF